MDDKKGIATFNPGAFLLGILIIIISSLIFYSLGSRKPALFKTIDFRVMDTMFQIRGPEKTSGQVVIVDIDEKSLGQLGQWPWPRNILADLTSKLIQNKARSIGFDAVFPEIDRTSPASYFGSLPETVKNKFPEKILSDLVNDARLDYDALFAQALSEGPTILGYVFKTINDGLKKEEDLPFPSGTIKIYPPNFKIRNLNLRPVYRAVINTPSVAMAESEGFFNVFAEESGITRRVPLFMQMDGIPYPSLAFETYRVGCQAETVTIRISEKVKRTRPPILAIQIKNTAIPTDEFAQLFVNYRGSVNSFPYIPAVDIINSSRAAQIKDKFVLIGSSAKGLYDLRATPFTNSIPGVEINATIIDNLIQADPFVYDQLTEIGLTYTFIIIGGLLISLFLSTLGPISGSLCALTLILGSTVFNYHYYFLHQRYVGLAYPLFSGCIILFTLSIFNAFREQKGRRFIRKAFSHYVAKDVVKEMLKNPKSLSLTGEDRELTVLFSDIRDFTTISETMPSNELASFMNNYLSRMSRIIIENGGTVDKFIGDAIMAFWGAPREDDQHAFKAVKAAMEMKAESRRLRDAYSKNSLPDIYIGIGINTGIMSVGNFGSNERFDYTVMGDNVNLASRLEGANKNYGTTILLSESTKTIVGKKYFIRYIDKVQVKGRVAPVDIFEPLVEEPAPRELKRKVEIFSTGVRAYQHHEFEKAKKIMAELMAENPHKLFQSYLDRINAFLASPPPEGWTGIERRERLPVNKLTQK